MGKSDGSVTSVAIGSSVKVHDDSCLHGDKNSTLSAGASHCMVIRIQNLFK